MILISKATHTSSVLILWRCLLFLLLVSGISSKHMTSTSSSLSTTSEITATSSLPTVLKTNDSFPGDITDYVDFNRTSVAMGTNDTEPYCKERNCMKKCCPYGQLLDTSTFLCEDVSLYGMRVTDDHYSQNESFVGAEAMREMWIRAEFQRNVTCGYFSQFDMSVLNAFLEEVDKLSFYQELSCSDRMYYHGHLEDRFFACHVVPDNKDRITIDMIAILNSVHLPLLIVSFISISLLVFLLMMYFISPQNNDLQLKCTVSLAVAMLLRLSLRVFYYMYGGDPNFEDKETCGIIGVSRIYSYLCVSFWLNVMCYELSRVIRGSMKFIALRDLMKSKWRFTYYIAYAWGVPLLICILILGLYLPEEFLQDSKMKPSFIPVICLRNPFHTSTYLFSYGPIGILFLMDTAFMVHIGYLLHKEQIKRFFKREKTPSVQIRSHSSKNHIEWFKQRLYIYTLFVLMRVLRNLGMQSSNTKFFAIAIILTMTDVLGSLLLFFIVLKSNNYSLPKGSYARLSSLYEKFSIKKIAKDSQVITPGNLSSSTSSMSKV